MTKEELAELILDLIDRNREEEWFEFKVNWWEPHEIGEYISALSNEAAVCGVEHGLLIWGINDQTHEIMGTNIDYKKEIKKEPFQNYLLRQIYPNIFFEFKELTIKNKRIVALIIQRATNAPTSFDGVRYARGDSSKINCAKYTMNKNIQNTLPRKWRFGMFLFMVCLLWTIKSLQNKIYLLIN